jgi:hypothetical protein
MPACVAGTLAVLSAVVADAGAGDPDRAETLQPRREQARATVGDALLRADAAVGTHGGHANEHS